MPNITPINSRQEPYKSCEDRGCTSGARLTVNFDGSRADLLQSSLHACVNAVCIDGIFKSGALHPPIAQERLAILPDNLVRIELRRPFRDQTVAIDLDPLSLLCRLAASVLPPGFHLVHYAEVLGSAAKLRALVVPAPPPELRTDSTPSRLQSGTGCVSDGELGRGLQRRFAA